MGRKTASRRGFAAVLAAASVTIALAARAAPEAVSAATTFAEVNGTAISAGDYETALHLAAARRFYHRQPPEEQFVAFKREVADALVNRTLLLAEASRRGIEPDRAKVQGALDEYDSRYRDRTLWREQRAQTLPRLRRQLEDQSVLEQLEHSVRAAPEPGEGELRAYYEAHAELFTEPEQLHLSLILLRVDPSAPRAAWDQAREEARAILARLARGAQFGEQARVHSSDDSAQRGGDMGYLHRGMLPEALYAEAAKLSPGRVSGPLTVLEGIALLRLEDRRAPKLREFVEARSRAAQLWRRERADKNWEALGAALRKTAVIRFDPERRPGAGGHAGRGP
jgi:parvulin-like peptidyl-prolyl isomerase